MMSYYWVYSGNSILIKNHVLSAAAKHQYMRMVRLALKYAGQRSAMQSSSKLDIAAINMQTRYSTNRQLLHWQHQAPCLLIGLGHDTDFDV
jgi:hypothetical protein